jgi:tetratricopeptide (TPR) repeat protein
MTELLSNNFGYIVIIVFLTTQKKAIASFITRLTKLTFKNGDSELGIEACVSNNENTKESLPAQSMEPIIEKDEDKKIISQLESEDGDNFRNMMLAFTNGDIDEAKAEFEKYAIKEEDTTKLAENKAIYLYRLFENVQDNSAIKQLEQLADTVENEESKYKVLLWLSFCFHDSSQYNEDIKLWEKALSLFSIEILITKSTINLSRSLNQTDDAEEAKRILISRLQAVATNDEKSKIYSALSTIELSLNNTKMSIFCKDKSLEYNPNDKDALFNTAYDAGEKDINELSLSNYITLLRIDCDNALALNNLGVQAQEAELKILAVNNYKKSSEYKNTLAMANKGFLLLDAGFLEEAEKIALEAIEMEDTHPNIYSLLTKINDSKKEEETKWNALITDAQKRQKCIRDYTNSYYIQTTHTFHGAWILPNAKTIDISVTDNKLKANWSEKVGLAGTNYNIEIIADINNSSFRGQYKKVQEGKNNSQNLLFSLAGDENISCFGIMAEDGKSIQIVAEDFKNKFSLLLKKVQ